MKAHVVTLSTVWYAMTVVYFEAYNHYRIPSGGTILRFLTEIFAYLRNGMSESASLPYSIPAHTDVSPHVMNDNS